jgi:hypothetical protein
MNNGDGRVLERINDAVQVCRLPGAQPKSILFGIEKSGALRLIDTLEETLTDESRLLAGKRGQPVKVKRYIAQIAGAF